MKHIAKIMLGLIAVIALQSHAWAGAVTYYHNDLAGSPLAATNEAGQLLWREAYRPYGERLTNSPAAIDSDVWFTSRRQDGSGLIYMGARYYDPVIGRFASMDPKGFDEKNIHSHNRYAYANNNPNRYVDPDGRVAGAVATAALGAEIGSLILPGPGTVVLGLAGLAVGAWGTWEVGQLIFNSKTDSDQPSGEHGKESNPYKGPVAEPVIVVDQNGNAIPVGRGESISTSPNGDYQQVRGPNGEPTGTRLDRGGHRGQSDPQAEEPHAHRPGVTTPEGNPHLPIKEP